MICRHSPDDPNCSSHKDYIDPYISKHHAGESLERYVQWKYGTPDADSMSIEECEMDKEIPDSCVGNY